MICLEIRVSPTEKLSSHPVWEDSEAKPGFLRKSVDDQGGHELCINCLQVQSFIPRFWMIIDVCSCVLPSWEVVPGRGLLRARYLALRENSHVEPDAVDKATELDMNRTNYEFRNIPSFRMYCYFPSVIMLCERTRNVP